MSYLEKDLVVRRIVATDEEDLKELSKGIFVDKNTGLSFDYLPAVFQFWIKDPNINMYGLEYQGKLVGFRCKTFLDQGRTEWSEGLRIHQGYRGKNFLKKFNLGISHLHKTLPQAIRIRYTTAEPEIEEKRTDYTLIDVEYIFACYKESTFDLIQSVMPPWPKASLQLIEDPNQFYSHAFQAFNLGLCNDFILSDWKAYEISLDSIITLSIGKYASSPKHDFWIEPRINLNGIQLGNGFSVSNLRPKVCGIVYNCTIYASSPEAFKLQLLFHLQRAKEFKEAKHCVFMYGKKWKKEINSILKFLENTIFNIHSVALFEKKIN